MSKDHLVHCKPPLELKSQVDHQPQVALFAGPSHTGTKRTEHGTIVVSGLHAPVALLAQDVGKAVVVLRPCTLEKDEIVGGQLILQLQMSGNVVEIGHLDVMGIGKGLLRLEIMRKPVTAQEGAADERNLLAEKQTAIEQWLKGESVRERQRDAPVSTDLAESLCGRGSP